MVKQYLIGILLLCQFTIYAQGKEIIGKITNSIGKSLIGVSICQVNTENCTISDDNGFFHLSIDNRYLPQLKIANVGYKTLTFTNLDTIPDLLVVKMTSETVSKKYIYIDKRETYPKRKLKYGFISFIQADLIFYDFDDYRPLLKDYNVDLMNTSRGILSYEMAVSYNRYFAGLNFGFANDADYSHDSLDIKFNTNQYGLHFGYNLLNTKRLLFTPEVTIKWNRYRLLNNDKDNRIPIEQYVSERDLDIRFNQMTGSAGFNLSYKVYKYNLLPTDYWTFGIYGGYIFKLHDKPWIYSRDNRLTSNGKIGIENYNIGMQFSFNFDGQ